MRKILIVCFSFVKPIPHYIYTNLLCTGESGAITVVAQAAVHQRHHLRGVHLMVVRQRHSIALTLHQGAYCLTGCHDNGLGLQDDVGVNEDAILELEERPRIPRQRYRLHVS